MINLCENIEVKEVRRMKPKWYIIMLVLLSFLIFPACAYIDGNYSLSTQQAFQRTQQIAILAHYGFGTDGKPLAASNKGEQYPDLFSYTVDDQGRMTGGKINLASLAPLIHPPERLRLSDLQKPAPHPFVQWCHDTLYSPFASAFVYVWGAVRIADTISDGAGHNTTNTNSGNSNSGNVAGGDQGVSSGAGQVTIDKSSIDNSTRNSNNPNNSIKDSYNPDVELNDSFNPTEINDSYNPTDNRQNYENDNRQNYDNPVDNRYNYDNPDYTGQNQQQNYYPDNSIQSAPPSGP